MPILLDVCTSILHFLDASREVVKVEEISHLFLHYLNKHNLHLQLMDRVIAWHQLGLPVLFIPPSHHLNAKTGAGLLKSGLKFLFQLLEIAHLLFKIALPNTEVHLADVPISLVTLFVCGSRIRIRTSLDSDYIGLWARGVRSRRLILGLNWVWVGLYWLVVGLLGRSIRLSKLVLVLRLVVHLMGLGLAKLILILLLLMIKLVILVLELSSE